MASEPHVVGRGPDVAVSVSIVNAIAPTVRAAVDALNLPVDALLEFTPSTGVGPEAIPSAAHLRAFVDSLRRQLSSARGLRGSPRAHLFYSGPLAGAAFLGHALGAAVSEV